MGQLFQGVVSNCSQGVLSTTSGKITTNAFTRSVKGSIDTTHHHYTTFDIGNMGFKLKGDYPLRDGDAVVFYAAPSGGYYEVQTIKNFTRNYFIRDKLAPMRAYLIWGILLACGAFWLIIQAKTLVMTNSTSPTAIGVFLFGAFFGVTSLKCFIKMPMANYKDKQNKIIENYNPRLTQADNIALTQAQLANESKKRFLSLPSLLSLLFWALVGALTALMLGVVSGAINEIIEAQWAKSIELWFKDYTNILTAWVVATIVLWVLNFINKRKQISVISIFMRLFLGLLGGFGIALVVSFALDLSGNIVLATWAITTLVLWIFGVFGFIRKRKQNKITN